VMGTFCRGNFINEVQSQNRRLKGKKQGHNIDCQNVFYKLCILYVLFFSLDTNLEVLVSSFLNGYLGKILILNSG
jgi:hypothetical protein